MKKVPLDGQKSIGDANPIDGVPSRTRCKVRAADFRKPLFESFGLGKLQALADEPHLALGTTHEVFEVFAKRHHLGAFLRTQFGPGGGR